MYEVVAEKQSQVDVKRSKFLGFAFYVDSMPRVKEILTSFEGKYKGSAHTVYAYRFLDEGVLKEKFDNDKEPVGSAGPPLLSLLQKKGIMNAMLVVVRYYGGVNLGTGGFVRAYTEAGQQVLEDNYVQKN